MSNTGLILPPCARPECQQTKTEIANKLWTEYQRIDDWPLQTQEGAHGAKCAIRCAAVSLGVYPEFVELSK